MKSLQFSKDKLEEELQNELVKAREEIGIENERGCDRHELIMRCFVAGLQRVHADLENIKAEREKVTSDALSRDFYMLAHFVLLNPKYSSIFYLLM